MAETVQRTAKPPPHPRLPKMVPARPDEHSSPIVANPIQRAFAEVISSNTAADLVEQVKTGERSRTKFFEARRDRGAIVNAIITPISAAEQVDLNNKLDQLIERDWTGLNGREKAELHNMVLGWLQPITAPTVLRIERLGPSGSLEGLLMVVSDLNAVKDQFQYTDYGKVLSTQMMSEEELLGRFSHMFSIEEEKE